MSSDISSPHMSACAYGVVFCGFSPRSIRKACTEPVIKALYPTKHGTLLKSGVVARYFLTNSVKAMALWNTDLAHESERLGDISRLSLSPEKAEASEECRDIRDKWYNAWRCTEFLWVFSTSL